MNERIKICLCGRAALVGLAGGGLLRWLGDANI
jgi:hypothetical protein